MGTGYTRKDTTNNIADGNIINASDLDNEFDGIEDAFDATTGHDHDGSANGAPITKVGPAQDLVVSTGAITPKTDNTVDLGSSSFEFKDLYIDGTANIDSLVADTADINGGTIDNVTIAGSTINGASNTISNINLASQVTGTLPIANGGTGQTTTGAALNALLPSQTSNAGKFLKTDGTNTSWDSAGGGNLVIDSKTANYTVVSGDLGKIINCTANSFTVSLTAAATLGAGFEVTIWNTSTTSSHAITIDPDGSETIDGRSTLILRRGEGMQIVCDGTNWQTGDKKTMRGYAENLASTNVRPIASGDRAISIAYDSQATATDSLALGSGARATALATTAIGLNSGQNGSQAVTGSGAMALGGSYASGTDSFAAAIANNTSSYGATGANGVAVGKLAKAASTSAVALGESCSANSAYSIAMGLQSTASATSAAAIGRSCQASAQRALATGCESLAARRGKHAHAEGMFAAVGDAQYGLMVIKAETTNDTPTALTTTSSDSIILPNSSAYAFSGLIVARQQAADGTASAAWKVEGLIRREANAASTVLVNSATTVIDNTPGWAIALTADTTNGGLAVTVTGAAATDIRWVATMQTSEVTYA